MLIAIDQSSYSGFSFTMCHCVPSAFNQRSRRIRNWTIDKENNATGHFSKDNYWKRCAKLDNGKSKLNNSCKNLVQGIQFCSLWAATRMYLHNSQTFLLH